MEYCRPKRYVTYKSKKCKKYLEKDFNHECAYCKFKEILSINRDGWEIDHFKPVSKFKNWEGIDKYENLFYSCKTCNNNKDNEWSETLLNPCKDDIYGVHIRENEAREMIPLTERGKEYIETLKINATQSVLRRKKLAELKKLRELAEKLEENKEKIEDICYETEDDVYVKKFQEILSSYNIKSTYGLYEYDLDFKLIYNNKEIFCDLEFEPDLKFVKHKKSKRILKEKIKDWINLDRNVCYILMDITLNRLYYYRVSGNIERSNKYITIQIEEENDLEKNIKDFKKIFFSDKFKNQV